MTTYHQDDRPADRQARHRYPPRQAAPPDEVLFAVDDEHDPTADLLTDTDRTTPPYIQAPRPRQPANGGSVTRDTPTQEYSRPARTGRRHLDHPSDSGGLLAGLTGGDLARHWADETATIRGSLTSAILPCMQAVEPLRREALSTIRKQSAHWADFLQGPRRNLVNIVPAEGGSVPSEAVVASAPGIRVTSKLEPAQRDPLLSGGGNGRPETGAAQRFATFGSSLRDMLSSTLMLDEPIEPGPLARKRGTGSHLSAPNSPAPRHLSTTTYPAGPNSGLRQRRGPSPVRRSLDSDRPPSQRRNPATVRAIIHRVVPADTMAGICLKYGISPAALKKVNRLWSTDSIHFRDQLFIPVALCDSREVHLYNTVMMNAESPFYQPEETFPSPPASGGDGQAQGLTARSRAGSELGSPGAGPGSEVLSPGRGSMWDSTPSSPTHLCLDTTSQASSAAARSRSDSRGKSPARDPLVPDIRAVPADLLKYFPSGISPSLAPK
ncbi:hypothetical protein IWQ60_005693 [Tieghemiomyces parasiticus]|uniref:LysM domain-containing protein n=1 Tax=Tieghemiomyces parasiticus TaxID=78921 RepID=A0A9W8A8N4_9FUNG|nr:hypothetical protein IWQ60_005693 [Tieghemiomyces parasiticus]